MPNIFVSTQSTHSGFKIQTLGVTPAESLMSARKIKAKRLCANTQKHGKGLRSIFNFFEFTVRDSIEDLKQIYTKNGGGFFAISEICVFR